LRGGTEKAERQAFGGRGGGRRRETLTYSLETPPHRETSHSKEKGRGEVEGFVLWGGEGGSGLPTWGQGRKDANKSKHHCEVFCERSVTG